jgi:hypothetical protein
MEVKERLRKGGRTKRVENRPIPRSEVMNIRRKGLKRR